jgi:parallel beta-helix repeat protein
MILTKKLPQMNLFINNSKVFLLFSIILLTQPFLNAQCLNSGGIGSFTNTTDFDTDWFSATQGNATFDVTTEGSYYGTSSLKVDVTTESTWQVRMCNRSACYFPITSGQDYTVSFYAKGKVGNDFTVTLMDNATDLVSVTQEMELDEWMFYTLKFTSSATSSNGRIKFNFLNVGAYYIDELVIKTGGFNTWYVSTSGTNSLAGSNGLSAGAPLNTIAYAINTAWTTGDIIYVMDGTYTNNNYGSGNKNNGSVVSINKAGTLNGPLVIRNHPGHTPKIEFDGAGGFVCGTGQYLEISGFEIQGPNQQITKTEAEVNRLNNLNYYKGRGIAVWAGSGGHHILLHSNKVYDCPASGVRINNSDYCTITNNEVNNCTTWTASGESAIVLAQSKNIDNTTKIKMRITKNLVHDNVNKIHYYNPNYACPDPTQYGCVDYPNIIDGSGCYITRNNDRGSGQPDENPNGQYTGAFYFANNVSYGNGINGVVVHKSDNSIVANNTVYKNGQVPLSEGRQDAVGITVNNSVNVRIYNNIVWTEFTSDTGFQRFGTTTNISGSNNILINGQSNIEGLTGMITSDPLFVDDINKDFNLTSSSPAIDAGILESNISLLTGIISPEYIPVYDFIDNDRALNLSDIGAYEYFNSGALSIKVNIENYVRMCPNPATDNVTVSNITNEVIISVYDFLGKQHMLMKKSNNQLNQITLDIKSLKSGIYFIKISDKQTFKTFKLIKR